MKIENIQVTGFEAAFRGMRNPLNSWAKSTPEADVELGAKLSAAGAVHGKFLRMITITCDITAPLYWWKEFDTYKVGTVANSCSTMHTLMNKPFEISDFELANTDYTYRKNFSNIVDTLNDIRNDYIDIRQRGYKISAEAYWRTAITMLPSGYLQRRTVLLNYEVMRRIVIDRTAHKLQEWKIFIDSMKEELPYWDEFILGKKPLSADSESDCKTAFGKDISNEKPSDWKEEVNELVWNTKYANTKDSDFIVFKKLCKKKPIKWCDSKRDARLSKNLTGLTDELINIIKSNNNRLEAAEPSETIGTKNDPVNPSHYKDHCSIECIEAMEIAFGGWETGYFCLGNAFKYLWRHKHKNGQEDLEKAIWYLDKAVELGADPERINDFRDIVEKYMKEE